MCLGTRQLPARVILSEAKDLQSRTRFPIPRSFASLRMTIGKRHGSRGINESLCQIPIRIDPPIAEERPVRAAEFDLIEITRDDKYFFLVD